MRSRLDASAAKGAVPDLHARARQALDRADAAPDTEQRQAARTLAGVWLDAAEAEAARIEEERATSALLAQLDAAEAARIADERGRRLAAEELLRRDAGRIARAQAQQAFAQAQLDEAGRRGGPTVDAQRREAARALRARARLVLGAAMALGAGTQSAAAVTEATAAIEQAEQRPRDAAAELVAARDALDASLTALGAARASRPAPTEQEHMALVEAATDRGLQVQIAPRGLLVDFGAAFAGRSDRLGKRARAALSQLRSLLNAHPHGPVRVEAYATAGGGVKLARRRARRVVDALQLPERAQVADGAHRLSADGHLVVVLTAYGR